ncbi:MAG TPA: lasso peptide biosynthesis B2 protein [Jatrophihabitantaceae bacterium]|nr:lasso peptide biosynthesis B2 protein [Jatrophihabitantaceae bacterium]
MTRGRLPVRQRILPAAAVLVAWPLSRLRPYDLRIVLERLRCGARPACFDEALAARDAVVSVSSSCAGQGCLQRSIAAALLCRFRGSWPTWQSGVRTEPFSAHAWIEVDGVAVGEPHPAGYFYPIMSVTPPSLYL